MACVQVGNFSFAVPSATLPTVASDSGSFPDHTASPGRPGKLYSHSASVGKRYVCPSCLLNHSQNATASFQLTFTTGWSSVLREAGRSPGVLRVLLERALRLVPAIAPLAIPFRLGLVTRLLDELAELADRHLGRAQVERPGDPDPMLLAVDLLVVLASGSVSSEPIRNSPAGISLSFMPRVLVISDSSSFEASAGVDGDGGGSPLATSGAFDSVRDSSFGEAGSGSTVEGGLLPR